MTRSRASTVVNDGPTVLGSGHRRAPAPAGARSARAVPASRGGPDLSDGFDRRPPPSATTPRAPRRTSALRPSPAARIPFDEREFMTDNAQLEDGVYESTAVIDNGAFGTRHIRFEAGRLAQQAAGSVVAYLDEETMLLSATSASKQPKDHFDFFPLTVDVEERMYAAGRIPGSFFRREGRPSTDAVLTCRLIDRPLRPSFVDGLRNEIQVVVTVMSLNPDDQYDVVAINAASASTQIAGLPFTGPIGATRISLITSEDNPAGQWVAFPTVTQLQDSVFDLVVAGRLVGDDVAIMMVEAGASDTAVDKIAAGAQ